LIALLSHGIILHLELHAILSIYHHILLLVYMGTKIFLIIYYGQISKNQFFYKNTLLPIGGEMFQRTVIPEPVDGCSKPME